MTHSIDVLILSNAPGELSTWVYPVLPRLQTRAAAAGIDARISIVLSPCQNASGNEAALAASFPGVARVLPPEQFYSFLLWGKTPDWDWRDAGVVVFLGGDQIYPVVIGKRLGYAIAIYAEWEARWLGWIDLVAARNAAVAGRIPTRYADKVKTIGDLMVDAVTGLDATEVPADVPDVAFLPGSKGHKLRIGVPLCVAIADRLHEMRSQASSPSRTPIRTMMALAPTLTPEQLLKYAPAGCALTAAGDRWALQTPNGHAIPLFPRFAANALLPHVKICVTTVGANTAELAAMAVPMLVLLPTNRLDTEVGWDGLPGLLVHLPAVGGWIATLINTLAVRSAKRQGKRFAWPNLWAGEEIVPELLGELTPEGIADRLSFYLNRPEELQAMRDRLRAVCSAPGAADRLAELAIDLALERDRHTPHGTQ